MENKEETNKNRLSSIIRIVMVAALQIFLVYLISTFNSIFGTDLNEVFNNLYIVYLTYAVGVIILNILFPCDDIKNYFITDGVGIALSAIVMEGYLLWYILDVNKMPDTEGTDGLAAIAMIFVAFFLVSFFVLNVVVDVIFIKIRERKKGN